MIRQNSEPMPGPVQIVSFENEQDEMIVRRFGHRGCSTMGSNTKTRPGRHLRDAALAEGDVPASTSLREQIKTFIHKHAGDRP